VVNDLAVRAVITVDGAPVGWLDPRTETRFEGFVAGRYRIAGLRPLGTLAWHPREVDLPATIRLAGR
jgi:hypothetical protein